MISPHSIFIASFAYVALLFAIAYFGDKRALEGRSITNNPYIYSLALAVYCTAWTFYGSVGQASRSGVGFLPIFIGPTLMMVAGWTVLRKIIRISKVHYITSLADLIASRYGKSTVLGGFVSIIAVIGVVPYISLQLKAIPVSYLLITGKSITPSIEIFSTVPIFRDVAFYITLILATFTILFGTRNLSATERHEGLVASIAFGSLIKLTAFLCAGLFITYGLFNGFSDIITQASGISESVSDLLVFGRNSVSYSDWVMYIIISMAAVLFLPRQFQMAVIENVDETHLNRAMWLFPLYLLVINIFVLPIALAGLVKFRGAGVDADTFVLSLAMLENKTLLTLFIFIGGLSAAIDMVIVETVALSTMISNDLVMPVLLRVPWLNMSQRENLSSLILYIRRGAIVFILLMGYFYFRYVGEFFALIASGLISFVAVAQFAPSVLGGIFWKGGTRRGAIWGLIAGITVWFYTLILPSLAKTGMLPQSFISYGPFGLDMLKPYSLFGLTGLNTIAHSAFWSLFVNVLTYTIVSLFSRPTTLEQTQAGLFVDVFKYDTGTGDSVFWRGTATVPDLRSLLERFLGRSRATSALKSYAEKNNTDWEKDPSADPGLVNYAEKLLSGAIGSASARIMIASVVKEEPLMIEDIMGVLDETRQVMEYSRQLEKATAANVRLKELDRLKDDFISTVTHELRTPLTSIRSLSELLHDTPDVAPETRIGFLKTIISESDRLRRLISQTLDFQKIESGTVEWVITGVSLMQVIHETVTVVKPLIEEKKVRFHVELPESCPFVEGDKDMLMQVLINLISNAVKFCDPTEPEIHTALTVEDGSLRVSVRDNGPGISDENCDKIFDRFIQIRGNNNAKPDGTGLGLAISRRIIDFHNGELGVNGNPGKGAEFYFRLPVDE